MRNADAVVVGAGVVGLSIARALARHGLSTLLIGEHRKGEASQAAGGMLAPSVEQSTGPAHDFAVAARAFYPGFLDALADETGICVPLNRLGVLQVALSEKGVKGLQKTMPATSRWLDRHQLADLEPALAHSLGAVLNPEDGAVDNGILMSALESYADSSEKVTRVESGAVAVLPDRAAVATASGDTLEGGRIIVASGAWGATIDGAPELRHVTPCRGQMISYRSIGLRHVTYGPRGYLVPRSSGTTVAGSTMENVGFDASTTPEGLARVRSAAREIAPGLAVAEITAEWAGLRPVTPDMLPIIGHDLDRPHLIYSSGHSRNGILLAPLSGEAVAALAVGEPPEHDLSQFRPGRF